MDYLRNTQNLYPTKFQIKTTEVPAKAPTLAQGSGAIPNLGPITFTNSTAMPTFKKSPITLTNKNCENSFPKFCSLLSNVQILFQK